MTKRKDIPFIMPRNKTIKYVGIILTNKAQNEYKKLAKSY